MITSYAQNFEDILLYRTFKHQKKGHYVDIGAWHPVQDSVTKLFYDLGWSGINVEPVERYHQLLVKERPRDVNLRCLIGPTNSSSVDFCDLGDSSNMHSYVNMPSESTIRNLRLEPRVIKVKMLT